MSFTRSILRRRFFAAVAPLLALTASLEPAIAQHLGAAPTEALINTLPLGAGDGIATIDVIAIVFALVAALLLYWVHAIRRRAALPAPGTLAMASAAPQIEASRSNIAQLIERIRTAERPDPGGLLLNGGKLLESDDEARRLVGVVALETVALGPDLPLAAAAIDQLAGHMQKRFRHSHEGEECAATAEALCNAGMKGRRCDRTLTFSARPSVQQNDNGEAAGTEPLWRLVGGVKLSRYIGGRIEGEVISTGPGNNGAVWCNGVRLVDCTVIDDAFGTSCVLTGCHVLRYDPERPLVNQFVHCDFSGCMISQATHLADLRDHGCWYAPNDPPQGDQPVKWTAFFHQDDPGAQPAWGPSPSQVNGVTHH